MDSTQSKNKKTLKDVLIGSVSGGIAGVIVGIASAAANSDFGSSETAITGISAAAGLPAAANSKFLDCFLAAGSANITYRVGYYGSRYIYELLRS